MTNALLLDAFALRAIFAVAQDVRAIDYHLFPGEFCHGLLVDGTVLDFVGVGHGFLLSADILHFRM